MSSATAASVHAIVPWAVLETVRVLDQPRPADPGGQHADLGVKRLGASRTVAAQIERFRALAARDAYVTGKEVEALLRLVGRRADAGLVFTDAGRRAARLGFRRAGLLIRGVRWLLPRRLRYALGQVIARRLAARFFGVALTKQGRRLVASAEHTVSADGTPDGSSCKFYASAVAGILAAFTDFDGALLHETCAARGDGACRWYTSTS